MEQGMAGLEFGRTVCKEAKMVMVLKTLRQGRRRARVASFTASPPSAGTLNPVATSPAGGSDSQSLADDFARDAWCLLGLPIDNLTLESTCRTLRQRVRGDRRDVLSTVNVNWIANSQRDPLFREAVLDSDICTLDGRPLLWLARWSGMPVQSVVPGSSLIDHLHQDLNTQPPVRLFLFGGEPGVAATAFSKINAASSGLRAVGYCDPGFGSLAKLSAESHLDQVNSAKPDLLLVALGAQRGQLWIHRNKHQLNANIISHLGTTINFLAGNETRAPHWLQRTGLEWSWRIWQRPALWQRYVTDGAVLMRLLVSRWLPAFRALLKQRQASRCEQPCSLRLLEDGGPTRLLLAGSLTHRNRDLIARQMHAVAARDQDAILDFDGVNRMDGSFLGLLLVLLKHQKRQHRALELHGVSASLMACFRLNCVDQSFAAMGYPIGDSPDCRPAEEPAGMY